jgi:hypothetical protein
MSSTAEVTRLLVESKKMRQNVIDVYHSTHIYPKQSRKPDKTLLEVATSILKREISRISSNVIFLKRSQCNRNDGFRVTNSHTDIRIQSNYKSFFTATTRKIILSCPKHRLFSKFHADLYVIIRNYTVPFVSSYNDVS